ncbi:MAG: hypothetical protein LQ343_006887 [Gyalolechia ehrenbergii]|nr:MAG: hypothetical protein LQ343_006887 [Gyalolechia ehrenbergii]
MSSHPRLLFRLSQTSVTPRRFLFSYFQRTSPCLRSTFSTTRQCASKKTRSVSPPKIPSKPRKAPPSSTYKPFTQTIAERSEPTLLYQGGSNTIYIAGCYSLGLLILAWTVHAAGQVYYHPPPFFNRFLKSMFYGACVLTVSMGTFFIIRPYRIIQTIQALPVSAKGARTLHLQIESARLLPGIRPRTVSVPATDISLSEQLHAEKHGGVSLHVLELRTKEAEKARRLREGNFMTLPLRQLGFHLWRGFQALKGVFTNNPFIYLRAKGYQGSWKLGKGVWWALDEGRALDRILRARGTV